jgi:hypothetical protein
MNENERYQRARQKVRRMRGFYIHAYIYAFVIAVLFFINILTSAGYLWFLWPAFLWGIGLAAHYLAIFGLGGRFGPEWEEQKIREILEKEEQQKKHETAEA